MEVAQLIHYRSGPASWAGVRALLQASPLARPYWFSSAWGTARTRRGPNARHSPIEELSLRPWATPSPCPRLLRHSRSRSSPGRATANGLPRRDR
eukprot:657414-Amorphochlora_amoeboformis.AAC.1